MKSANNAPMYCAMYPSLAEICRSHGYALAVHGTMARDFDMIAVPWIDSPSEPQMVVDEITKKHAVNQISGDPEQMRHGRICYTLALYGEFFFDFSFMPTTQHLRDVEAKAGRAGFIAGFKVMHGKSYQLSEVLERAADLYAESVKAGEK